MRPATEQQVKLVLKNLDAIYHGITAKLEYCEFFIGDDGVVYAFDRTCEEIPLEVLLKLETAGRRIGSIANGGFELDLQGATLFDGERTPTTIRLVERSSRAFLYGRTVPRDGVLSAPILHEGTVVLVADPSWRVLGMATWGKKEIRHLMDLGLYLREEEEES